MEKKKLDRISELAKKTREAELTAEEMCEQKSLREEFIAAYRENLREQLENMYVVDEKGNKVKLKKKGEPQ